MPLVSDARARDTAQLQLSIAGGQVETSTRDSFGLWMDNTF
jgi:hypothetical protein